MESIGWHSPSREVGLLADFWRVVFSGKGMLTVRTNCDHASNCSTSIIGGNVATAVLMTARANLNQCDFNSVLHLVLPFLLRPIPRYDRSFCRHPQPVDFPKHLCHTHRNDDLACCTSGNASKSGLRSVYTFCASLWLRLGCMK